MNFFKVESIFSLSILGVYGVEEYCCYYFVGEVISYLVGFFNIDEEG